LFAALAVAMSQRIAQWDRGAGFAAIRADWLARAAGRHRPIRVALGDAEQAGLFESVDERGHLVLRLPDGTSQTIAAGDVVMASRL
jgi:BirA family biotin operon repressor/biotin-[acetyl-CoA-carboxylase] ligase